MSHRSLADLLEELGRTGELARIEPEVDPVLELAEVSRRMAAKEGPALLFGGVKGHGLPVLANLLATEARVCRALGGATLGEAAQRIARVIQPAESGGWLSRWGLSGHAVGPLAGFAPRMVKSAPCQQVVRLAGDVDLDLLPLVQCTSGEAGPMLTAGAVFTAEPDSHRPVAGRHDLQRLARDRLAVGWMDVDEPARLLEEYQRRGGRMPLAVALGGDPACLLAASALAPATADPLALAGLLREKPLDAVACRTVDLRVPAEADIVLEGYIDPASALVEAGPFCTPLGPCSLPRWLPVMHVTALTHRANPVFPALVHGPPPNEASAMARALACIFQPLVRLAMPELVDYDLPPCGGARHWAVLSIRKTYAGQARRVASLAWGLRQFLFAKVLVVVDEDVDVRDMSRVLGAVAATVEMDRDVFSQAGPRDPLDPAAPLGVLGQRLAMDATRKLPQERAGARPGHRGASAEAAELVSRRWAEYGLPAP